VNFRAKTCSVLVAVILLSGCAAGTRLTIEPCEIPILRGETNYDAWLFATEAKANILSCNARIGAVSRH
jgi:hypothetical protein